ncbi:MAG TPA: carboxypeptidase-like regulatory domain-containing protein [Bryobacteraceae bacterium]|nr:carboxypeptidase-like regulatory domain-containing protein [Bryobacteraceae bacterium]
MGSRDVIFAGRVVYSNDDGSGRFAQGTLVRFAVEEVFKGLPEGTAEVWIDPGSYTSCYAGYKVGERYLVFASRTAQGTSAMFITRNRGPQQKPVPPGFDIRNPPDIYISAECHGSRLAGYAADDVRWLRAWRAGKTTTRIYGRILEHYDMYFLPPRDEPPLAGAMIAVRGASGTYTATSNANGEYEIKDIPPGSYTFSASLEHYHLRHDNLPVQLAPGACALMNPGLFTTGEIAGTAVGPDGKPLAGLKLDTARVFRDGTLHYEYGRRIITGSRGEFEITELSSGDFLLGVNLRYGPTLDVPYMATYFPGTHDRESAQLVHVNAAEHKEGLVFRLPAPLLPRDVQVTVRWPDGKSVTNVRVAVFLEVGGHDAGLVNVGQTATVALPCLKGLKYRIWARAFIDDDPRHRNRRIADGEVELEAGEAPAKLAIVLDKPDVLP